MELSDDLTEDKIQTEGINSRLPIPTRQKHVGDNIVVSVRLRPSMSNNEKHWETKKGTNCIQYLTKKEEEESENDVKSDLYTFDNVFDEKCRNENVYKHGVNKTIRKFVIEGKNSAVIAYGQPRSGKTYTMYGNDYSNQHIYQPGIIQLIANDIFSYIEDIKDRYHAIVRASYVEIYKEEIRDLLEQGHLVEESFDEDKKVPTKIVTIREDTRRGIALNSTEIIVRNRNTIAELIDEGYGNSLVSTVKTEEARDHVSSKSHTIFRITLERREKKGQNKGNLNSETDQSSESNNSRRNRRKRLMIDKYNANNGKYGNGVSIATLNIVDVASANVRTLFLPNENDTDMRERFEIDQSFLSLSHALVDFGMQRQRRFLNFRDSKLTRILQPSLSGNAQVALVCCMATDTVNIERSKATLELASKIKEYSPKASSATEMFYIDEASVQTEKMSNENKPNQIDKQSTLTEDTSTSAPDKVRMKHLERQLELKHNEQLKLMEGKSLAEKKAEEALEKANKLQNILETMYGDDVEEKDDTIKKFKWKARRRAQHVEVLLHKEKSFQEQVEKDENKIKHLESQNNNLLEQANIDGSRIKNLASKLAKSENLCFKKDEQIKLLKENKKGNEQKLQQLKMFEESNEKIKKTMKDMKLEKIALLKKIKLLRKENHSFAKEIETLTGVKPDEVSLNEDHENTVYQEFSLSEQNERSFLDRKQDEKAIMSELASIFSSNKDKARKKIKELLQEEGVLKRVTSSLKISDKITDKCNDACGEISTFRKGNCIQSDVTDIFSDVYSNDETTNVDIHTLSTLNTDGNKNNSPIEDTNKHEAVFDRTSSERDITKEIPQNSSEIVLNEDSNPEAQRPLDERNRRLLAVIGQQLVDKTTLNQEKEALEERVRILEEDLNKEYIEKKGMTYEVEALQGQLKHIEEALNMGRDEDLGDKILDFISERDEALRVRNELEIKMQNLQQKIQDDSNLADEDSLDINDTGGGVGGLNDNAIGENNSKDFAFENNTTEIENYLSEVNTSYDEDSIRDEHDNSNRSHNVEANNGINSNESFQGLRHFIELNVTEGEQIRILREVTVLEEKRKILSSEIDAFNKEIQSFFSSMLGQPSKNIELELLLNEIIVPLDKYELIHQSAEQDDQKNLIQHLTAEKDTFLFQRNALVEEIGLVISERDTVIAQNVELKKDIDQMNSRILHLEEKQTDSLDMKLERSDTSTRRKEALDDKDDNVVKINSVPETVNDENDEQYGYGTVEYESGALAQADAPSELTFETTGDDLQYLFAQMKNLVFERDQYEDRIKELIEERNTLQNSVLKLRDNITRNEEMKSNADNLTSLESRTSNGSKNSQSNNLQIHNFDSLEATGTLEEKAEYEALVKNMSTVLKTTGQEKQMRLYENDEHVIMSQTQTTQENDSLGRRKESFREKLKAAIPRAKQVYSENLERRKDVGKSSTDKFSSSKLKWVCDSFCI